MAEFLPARRAIARIEARRKPFSANCPTPAIRIAFFVSSALRGASRPRAMRGAAAAARAGIFLGLPVPEDFLFAMSPAVLSWWRARPGGRAAFVFRAGGNIAKNPH